MMTTPKPAETTEAVEKKENPHWIGDNPAWDLEIGNLTILDVTAPEILRKVDSYGRSLVTVGDSDNFKKLPHRVVLESRHKDSLTRLEGELRETEADNFTLKEDFQRAYSEATIAKAQVDNAIESVRDRVPLSEGYIPVTEEEQKLLKYCTDITLQLSRLEGEMKDISELLTPNEAKTGTLYEVLNKITMANRERAHDNRELREDLTRLREAVEKAQTIWEKIGNGESVGNNVHGKCPECRSPISLRDMDIPTKTTWIWKDAQYLFHSLTHPATGEGH